MATDKTKLIRYIYLYLVTAISIVMVIIASVGMINLVLDEYVFDVKSWEELDPIWECGEEGDYGVKQPVESEEALEMTEEEKEECLAEVTEQREMRHLNNLKRDLVDWIAMLLVAVPVYLYHWKLIKKDAKSKK